MKTDDKKQVALASVWAAVFITGFKLVVGIETNSLGILSEAAHSGLDMLAALMTLFAVTIADKPPDADHNYGHGKVENLSAFLETLLLVITCAWIIWEAVDRLTSGSSHVTPSVWGFIVMGVSIVIDLGRSRALKRSAIKHNSQALEADALHFSSDVWSSMVVILGLGFVMLGYPALDAVAAITVAFLVLFVSYRLGRRTIDALMDRVPEGLSDRMLAAVRDLPGVEEVRSLRVRSSGARVFVDITVAIRRTTSFEQAHMIMDTVERAVLEAQNNVEVMVHAEPCVGSDESIEDKIRMIAVEMGLRAPHNIGVSTSNGRHFIDFDLEYERGETFVEAHRVSAAVEERIRATLPSVEKVTIHMEEHLPEEKDTVETTERANTLTRGIMQCVMADPRVLRCSEVMLLQAGNKYNLSLTCQIAKTRTLDEVHQIISELEAVLYDRFKNLRRVTIHAEPG